MNLEEVYPNENACEQRIIEETPETIGHKPNLALLTETRVGAELVQDVPSQTGTQDSTTTLLDTTIAVDIGRGGKGARPKKMKIKEVRSETQTSMEQHPLCQSL